MKIKNFFREYKVELLLEMCIVIAIIILGYLGKVKVSNMLDGTFLAAALSIPLVVIQYISSKKKDKEYINENLYYEKLDKLIEIAGESDEYEGDGSFYETKRDEKVVSIRLMQLNNIYESGKRNISTETFEEIVKDISYRLIFKGIRVDESQRDFKDMFSDRLLDPSGQLDDYLMSVSKIVEDSKNFSAYRSDKNKHVFNDMFIWGEKIEMKNPENSSDDYSDKIFFSPVLVDFAQDDIDKYSHTIFVKPTFKYRKIEKESDISKKFRELDLENYMRQDDGNLGENAKDNMVLFIKPEFEFNNKIKSYSELKNESERQKRDFKATYIFDAEPDRSELRKKYGKTRQVKLSRTYPNEKEYAFESWFRIHKKAWEDSKGDDRDIVFIITNKAGEIELEESLIIIFKREDLNKLIDRKDKGLNLDSFDFYFKIKQEDYEKYKSTNLEKFMLYDTRNPDDKIEITLTPYVDR